MHKDWSAKTKNAISMDATRTISKWLNEPTDAPLDRVALATVLARVGFLENELQGLKNVFDAMLGRTAGIVELMQTAQYELRQANIVGNHALNNMPTHYSSEPYVAAAPAVPEVEGPSVVTTDIYDPLAAAPEYKEQV